MVFCHLWNELDCCERNEWGGMKRSLMALGITRTSLNTPCLISEASSQYQETALLLVERPERECCSRWNDTSWYWIQEISARGFAIENDWILMYRSVGYAI